MSASETARFAPKRITKGEAALRLDVPVAAVNRMIARGELRTAPIGNVKAIVLEDSLNELIARMTADDRQAG